MPPDLSKAVQAVDFPPTLLCQVIMEHFLRSGRVDLARRLAQEANLSLKGKDVDVSQTANPGRCALTWGSPLQNLKLRHTCESLVWLLMSKVTCVLVCVLVCVA